MNWFKMTSLALVAVLCALLAPTALGQLVGRPIGDDPAYWWTLTDEITPEQLRAELQSREKSQERMRAAIQAGLHPPVSEEGLAKLGFYLQGRLTPELVPMWEAFDSWASALDYYPGWEEILTQYLDDCKLSSRGADLVMAVSYDHNARAARLVDRLGNKASVFFSEVLRPARQRFGRSSANRMAEERNFGRFTAVSGKSATEIADLYDAWNTDPAAETSLDSIKELRQVLSDDDWELLRTCLLGTTARELSRSHYGPEAFR